MNATIVVPRPVVCVIDHLGRSLAVADDVVTGRFDHCGTVLELGPTPNWLTDGLADDEEWRIEWVKSYELLDLAHAAATTGNECYVRRWEQLIDGFCAQVPIGHDSSDVTARRLQNWLYSWNRLANAGIAPDTGLVDTLYRRVIADAEHLGANLTSERNHRTLELYALLLIAVAFPDHDVDPEVDRAATVIDQLAANLHTDIWADGVQRECSTDYHMIVLRSFVGAVANAQQFGVSLPDGFVDRVHRACDFALHIQRPDGLTPSFSDGDVGDFRALLELAGAVLARPDLTWAATAGDRGQAPMLTQAVFAHGGYASQRSGWGDGPTPYADERHMVFDAGPLGDGGHGHYDHLSIEISAVGHSIVTDPGRFTYAETDDGLRKWFKGTAAHNTVTVDGLDQTPYRRGKPKGPTSCAHLVAHGEQAGLGLLVGRAVSPSYSAVHTRRIAFVDRSYWVIHDRLVDAIDHRYEARWHLAPETLGQVSLCPVAGGFAATTDHYGLFLPMPATSVTVESGWVSPSYGVKLPAPVIVARHDGSTADIVTVIVPFDRPAAFASVTAAVTTGELQVAVQHASDGCVDRLVWSVPLGDERRAAHLDARWWRSSGSPRPRSDIS